MFETNIVYQPILGLKCPISFSTVEHPVYLKGCDHFFERDNIEKFFRSQFLYKSAANCPECAKTYSLVKYIEKYGSKEQAINEFFKRILIVPVVIQQVNDNLVKMKEYKSLLKDSLRQIEEQKILIDTSFKENQRTLEMKEKQIDALCEKVISVLKERDLAIQEKTSAMESLSFERKVSRVSLIGGVATLTVGFIFLLCSSSTTVKYIDISHILEQIPKTP